MIHFSVVARTCAMAIALFSLVVASEASNYEKKNVFGDSLQPCSQDGMALTGFTRTGECVEYDGDSGSHHICINISSNTGGNFCEVTGQPNWCQSQKPCTENQSLSLCPVQNWCVCQWAFASYIKNAGGCEEIQDIVCDATHLRALEAYRSSEEKDHKDALECLERRCGLSSSNN